MMATHSLDDDTRDGEIEEEVMNPQNDEASSKDNINVSEMKTVNENSVDDDNQQVFLEKNTMLLLSDDEDSNLQSVPSRKNKMMVLSDDEDSNLQSPSGTSHATNNDDGIHQTKMRMIGSDAESEEENLFFKEPGLEKPKPKVVYNSDIFDTELSDEDDQLPDIKEVKNSLSSPPESKSTAPPKDKKKVKKARQSSEKAGQELTNIRSETQRLVRESRISLPYHRPKQRTLAEFLARRKQIMPPQIKNQSLKMTMRNMDILRSLEEKKKQVDEFFKSDSDSEDPDDCDWTPGKDSCGKDYELSPTVTTNLPDEDDALPDLSASLSESFTQEKDPKENCPASQSDINHSVIPLNEGLSASEQSIIKEDSGPSDATQIEDAAGLEGIQSNLPAMEDINSEDKVKANIREETAMDTEVSSVTEEAAIEEQQTPLEESHQVDKSSSTYSTPNVTPKLKFLASILPEEELKKILSVTPKLNSGKKDGVIDLSECTPSRVAGMNELKDRFLRHVSMETSGSAEKQGSFKSVSQQSYDTEEQHTITVGNDVKEDKATREVLPGAQFTSFKAALQAKIRKQREQHRLKRVQEKQFMETEEIPDDYHNDVLPDEEVDLTDKSETDYETESEPEENDVVITDTKRKKNCFLEDEAEVDEDVEEDGEPQEDALELETRPASDSDDESDLPEVTKERKRITNDPADDSDEEEERKSIPFDWDETQEGMTNSAVASHFNTDDFTTSLSYKKGESLDKDTSTTSFDSSFELYGSVIAGHQPGGGMKLSAENGLTQSLTKSKSTSFGSTFSSNSSRKQQELTLPAEDSVDMFNNEASSMSQGVLDLNFSSLDSTQPHDSNKENESFGAKLDLDLSRIEGTQERDELIGLCSGQFTDQAEAPTEMKDMCEDDVSPTQEMNELLGLCSGNFGDLKEKQNTQGNHDVPQMLLVSQREPDDELLGLCTSKFTIIRSADNQTKSCTEESQSENTEIENQTEVTSQMVIYSSEDDDVVDIATRNIRRKKRKRVIEFSDDEDAQEPLAFDNEENELSKTVFTGFKDSSKGGIRAEFLENEAELSGSDANSDDEAEGSNDELEEEDGDREYFDSNELRDQVGKAHLRTLLDTDKREVRLLQELYLEDGELHGEGRSRQFRWKNLDKGIDDDTKVLSEEEEGSDDNGEDTEWRKQKVEREKFLQEQRDKTAESDLCVLDEWPSAQKLTNNVSGRKPLSTIGPPRLGSNSNMFLKKQRGSFLNRDKTTLARIAEFTRDRRDVVGGAKQGGNFVFQQRCGDDIEEKKEENEEVTVNQKKRHSLPCVKKAKLDNFNLSGDNKRLSTSIFKHF